MVGKKTIQKLKDLWNKAIGSGCSPYKLAYSFSIGVFISFSPFPFLHSILMIAAHFLLRLNFPILFLATSLNNPWTAIPFFSCDYLVGKWLLHSCIGWVPSWTITLPNLFGSGEICLWSFLIGGNILGIITALISYPCMLYIFKKFYQNQSSARSSLSKDPYNENH